MFHREATIDHHLNHCLVDHPDINVDIINKIKHLLYVDDLLSVAEKLKDASELYIQYRVVFEKANMNLQKWKNSSNKLMMSMMSNKLMMSMMSNKLMMSIKKHEKGKN